MEQHVLVKGIERPLVYYRKGTVMKKTGCESLVKFSETDMDWISQRDLINADPNLSIEENNEIARNAYKNAG